MKKTLSTAMLAVTLLLSPPWQPETAHAAGAYTAKVYASSLNVRSEPAAGASVTGSLKSGALVTVTDGQHGWLKVRAGSVSGWVAGYYLKRTGGTAAAAPRTAAGAASVKTSSQSSGSAGGTAQVTASSLRIRGGPGTGYKVLGSLKEGDSVTVLLRQGDWARIRTASGEVGWIAGQYIARGGLSTGSTWNSGSSNRSGSIRGKTIVIDPGHGGSDPGMLGTSYDTMEKDLTLQTAFYVRDYLRAKGARVELTRTRGDQKPSLSRRVQIGQQLRADAFVSIHYNSSPKKVSGTLTFFYSENNDLRLARSIENRLRQGIGLKSNGLSFGDYHILRENSLPATLVELGFLSNRTDESIVRTASYQKKAAKAIAEGLADYFD
ncbi:N-acetylmuramoyl-L-alanine amidase [Paenibacillus graminis]|uniref:N-acetylmuramoyl-L-alanine amidase n=1 Tax=Paenibacillus graminis TaxID=189425 RepID=UPI002DB79CF6|nr:N-acetylmuramoyl-L-alanine amidase [Paenibacillus graminis]MEC0168209.1 N-acetylmuramoyl-L-alanine amidase [Paenibacillus graminis]